MSLIIWLVVLLIIVGILWMCFTDQGQRMLGNIANKGFREAVFGLGGTQAEAEAAAVLEKCGVIVIKEQPDQRATSLNFGNFLNPDDETLKQFTKLRHLLSVNLARVKINDEQLAYLSNLKNMSSLVLNATPVTDAGMVHLAGLPSLNALHLSNAKITDKGLEQIARISSLRILDISNTNISDQGMKYLANLENLDWLLIRGTKITDAGLSELNSLTDLKRLNLTKDMKISPEAILLLKRNFPKIQVDIENPSPAIKKDKSTEPEDQALDH